MTTFDPTLHSCCCSAPRPHGDILFSLFGTTMVSNLNIMSAVTVTETLARRSLKCSVKTF